MAATTTATTTGTAAGTTTEPAPGSDDDARPDGRASRSDPDHRDRRAAGRPRAWPSSALWSTRIESRPDRRGRRPRGRPGVRRVHRAPGRDQPGDRSAVHRRRATAARVPGPQHPRRLRDPAQPGSATAPDARSPAWATPTAADPAFQAVGPSGSTRGSTTRIQTDRRRAADRGTAGHPGRRDRALLVSSTTSTRNGPGSGTRCGPTGRGRADPGWSPGCGLAVRPPARAIAHPAQHGGGDRRDRPVPADPRDRQRRHHRADPHGQRDAGPAGGGVRRAATVPRRRRPRAEDAAHRAPRPPGAAGHRPTPRRSPRPARCCSTRSTGCPDWSAT